MYQQWSVVESHRLNDSVFCVAYSGYIYGQVHRTTNHMFCLEQTKHGFSLLFFSSSISLSYTNRALLVREVLLGQLVQLACLVDLVLRVLQVLLERREHL